MKVMTCTFSFRLVYVCGAFACVPIEFLCPSLIPFPCVDDRMMGTFIPFTSQQRFYVSSALWKCDSLPIHRIVLPFSPCLHGCIALCLTVLSVNCDQFSLAIKNIYSIFNVLEKVFRACET